MVARRNLDGRRLLVHGKGGKRRVIDLPQFVGDIITATPDNWLFPNPRHPDPGGYTIYDAPGCA